MRLPKLLRPFQPLLTPMRPNERFHPGFWTYVFGVILAAGAVVTVLRFWKGLGAVTNLSDKFPWGLWVGFDVLCGVALAAGGFTITAAVYVFNLKRFKPIVRPTVLTAFLGYTLVAVGLMYDLGKPWNIWHPMVMWNPRSPMFEVGWCVMLYLTVLALEFSGIVFEKLGWKKAIAVQHAATVPLVIAGAIISTLHQSSLGSFYLITPGKLHPLWYTPLLPWMFYFSAIAAGLAMMIVESRLSSRAFGRGLEMPLLQSLAKGVVVALGFYATVRLADMARLGVLGEVFAGTREARFFQLEMAIGVILPIVLLSLPAVRRNYGAALPGLPPRGGRPRGEPLEREPHRLRGGPGRSLRPERRRGDHHADAGGDRDGRLRPRRALPPDHGEGRGAGARGLDRAVPARALAAVPVRS